MPPQRTPHYWLPMGAQVAWAMAGFGFVCIVNGAVPLLATPTALQSAGFTLAWAESLANQNTFGLYAEHFGYPKPAAIPFGLTGALPASLFLRMGVPSPDAYTLMIALWLAAAYAGAYNLARYLGASSQLSISLTILWCVTPIVWGHAGYSMLSIGFALLPLYFLCAIRLFDRIAPGGFRLMGLGAIYCFVCAVAVFTDGYTFVMFAVGSTILWIYIYCREPNKQSYLMTRAGPVHFFSLAVAYLLYAAYIGKLDYPGNPLAAFRSYGLDLTFLAIPTEGVHWLWDALGASISRSGKEYFGDGSIWVTTFALPLITAGLICWWLTRAKCRFANVFLLIAVLAYYMALGPELKLDARRTAGTHGPMPEGAGLVSTGNAVIWKYVPGVRNMRAAYRWSGLGMFALWALVVAGSGQVDSRKSRTAAVLGSAILILMLMPTNDRWQKVEAKRATILKADRNFAQPLSNELTSGERVAFLPWGNDFLVNFAAPKADIRAFNIGGDKNLRQARRHWPQTLREFPARMIDESFVPRVVLLLVRDEADAVVLPYIDIHRSLIKWPSYPPYVVAMRDAVAKLQQSSYVEVSDRELFAVVRLRPNVIDERATLVQERHIVVQMCGQLYPMSMSKNSCAFKLALGKGWHDSKSDRVWSKRQAQLRLPILKDCYQRACAARLSISAYGASESRPVTVAVDSPTFETKGQEKFVFTDTRRRNIVIPLSRQDAWQSVRLEVPEATSPARLRDGGDGRVLGVALFSIELERGSR